MFETIKIVLALFGGVLIASGSTLFGQWDVIEMTGISHGNQIAIGLTMFVASMMIHIINGGSLFPWQD